MGPKSSPTSRHEKAAENAVGAYGLRLAGLDRARRLLIPAEPSWPRLEVVRRLGRPQLSHERVGADLAELRLQTGGTLTIDRALGRAVYTTPRRPSAEELVHPFLAPAAAIMAHWLGRDSFHAGGFLAGSGVWALLGERESGKSSTLAWLALNDHPVVADDMLIVDGGVALAGPRSIDLRREAAEHLEVGEPLGTVGARERWRLVLGSVEPRSPLRGWVLLGWGDRVESARLSASETLACLFQHRGVRLPPAKPESLLRLAALPCLRLLRPPAWTSLPAACRHLVHAVSS